MLRKPVMANSRPIIMTTIHAGASQLSLIDSVTGRVEVVQDWTALHTFLSVDAVRRQHMGTHDGCCGAGGEACNLEPVLRAMAAEYFLRLSQNPASVGC